MAKKVEPTLGDIQVTLTEVFGFMKTQFEKVERKFESIDKKFVLMNGQLDILVADMHEIKDSQKVTHKKLEAIKDDIYGLGESLYKQSKSLAKHGSRITALEEVK